jgi:hypothetical protein
MVEAEDEALLTEVLDSVSQDIVRLAGRAA